MLITELNIITQMQHQLSSQRQLPECLRNVPYLNKLFLAGNHVILSKLTAERIIDEPCRAGAMLSNYGAWKMTNPKEEWEPGWKQEQESEREQNRKGSRNQKIILKKMPDILLKT